jgi:hypothetical protein
LNGAPDHDQRGRSRPFGNGVDIGAFESSPPYVLAGKVYGFTLVDEVSVSDGSTTTITTTNRGLFRLKGLPVGIQTVSVTNSDYVFSPASQNVNLGPDRLDVTFQAFRWQTLSPEPLTNGLAQLVLAEPAGTTWRIDSSTNAVEWLPVYTNTVGANGMLQCLVPVNTTPPILYRAVKR